jgi:ubiquinone/menaquinone biosynthesis C-methylase UbiE
VKHSTISSPDRCRGFLVSIMEVKDYWNNNAKTWTSLSEKGYDLYRDHIASPAFFDMLPDVKGLCGLDIGCGEGFNTQKAAERGATIIGIDISEKFIKYEKKRVRNKVELQFIVADACRLPFDDNHFDFCISTQAFMDFPDQENPFREIYRVLKNNSFFQFSILHPCFNIIKGKWIYENDGSVKGYLIEDYFSHPDGEIDEWIFSALPEEERVNYDVFRIPRYNKPISEWINILVKTGFSIEEMREPYPSKETINQYPKLKDARIMPYFLIIRTRKT